MRPRGDTRGGGGGAGGGGAYGSGAETTSGAEAAGAPNSGAARRMIFSITFLECHVVDWSFSHKQQ